MPELPEVETIARGLAASISGKTIGAVRVTLARVVSPSPERFAAELLGRRVTAVGRRAKWVVVELDTGRRLLVHLRMTGRLIVQRPGALDLEPHTHVELTFTDGARLCFADVRTFGRMSLVDPDELWDAEVGVEPLSDAFSPECFTEMLRGRSTALKIFLLDQRKIAGIGNIYACEALWEARIRPDRPAGSLSKDRRLRLHAAIRDILTSAVAMRGTSVVDYVDAEGLQGGFQNRLSVYGRTGEPCMRCASPIVRTVLGQRGTWWCRVCQRT
ncbi:MAG TPA: bifunctional DNA-formamidopyrimidine glycosylase/DNA-(apurinic or apyrimidinic site) lyase [Candidatus Baltobacteraceae bacterium]|jgi:formamidopyrimidine-DNA glycosylase|nr:bifunctional DNA-formamidopyrimidine glycosylase/DNA-(apurinic or apyrimidinic site) lyase [Candidatus Baltobacteraceae bacterium]